MKIRNYLNNNLVNGDDELDVVIANTDLEQIFNVNVDKRGNYVFNLNSTLYMQYKDCDLLCYTVKFDTYDWPLLSYKIYGTTHFAWLLMKLNNITAKNVFNIIPAGTNIKCVSKEFIKVITRKLIDY